MLITKQVEKTTIFNSLDRLKKLDWGDIAYKLMYPDSGQGWTKEQTERAIANYLRFLAFKHQYPNVEIVPSEEIDKVWHTHILDTLKYAADCQAVFGRFIHHFPYFGIRGKSDRQNLEAAFVRTQAIFKEYFGVSLDGSSVCIIPSKQPVKPSVCIIPKSSVCIIPHEDTNSRPRADIDLDSYLATAIEAI